MDKNSLTLYSQQPNWEVGGVDFVVRMPFPFLPTSKAETSKPSPSMPTKTLRNQRNCRSVEDMWGLAQAGPFASVPFPTLPRALPTQTLGPVCFRVHAAFCEQEHPEQQIDRCPINSLINPLPLRLLPVDTAPKSKNVAALLNPSGPGSRLLQSLTPALSSGLLPSFHISTPHPKKLLKSL